MIAQALAFGVKPLITMVTAHPTLPPGYTFSTYSTREARGARVRVDVM
jgi:hypothetical protein